MELIEFFIDEENFVDGVNAISVVSNPAIESNFITLSADEIFQFKTVDDEKRILLGAVLIPNKEIVRNQELNGVKQKFKMFFSEQTVEKAAHLYLKSGKQGNSTLEHQLSLQGLSLVESWIKVDMD